MNPTNEQELRNLLGELQNRTVSAFTSRRYDQQNILRDEYQEAINAYINAEIARAKLEAFDVAFDCHDYDRLRAYRAKLLKEVK